MIDRSRNRRIFVAGAGKRGGAPAPGQALFDAYKATVLGDFGFINSDPKTLKLFNDSVKNSMRENLVFHVNSDAGNRGNVNKVYSLDGEGNDFTQTVAANQPALNAQGWRFDGNDVLFGGNPTSMQTGGDKCMMAWAKCDSLPAGSMAIFGAGYFAQTTGMGVSVNSTSYSCQARQGSSIASAFAIYADTPAPDPTQFFHIAGVRRGNITELYIQGIKVAETAPVALNTTPAQPFGIGARVGTFTIDFYFTGIIDDCRAYNFAPAPEKILQIFNQTRSKYGV